MRTIETVQYVDIPDKGTSGGAWDLAARVGGHALTRARARAAACARRGSIGAGLAVEVVLTGRTVKVTGPRGTLSRDFGHLHLELVHLKKSKRIKVALYFGARKQIAAVRTVCTHLKNLFTGVLSVSAAADRMPRSPCRGIARLTDRPTPCRAAQAMSAPGPGVTGL